MQKKKIPERKCVLCNERFPKNELIRVVRTPEGDVCLDPTGKKSGRGAYVFKSKKCLSSAKKGKRLDHALEAVVPDEIYLELENMANG